MFYNFNSNFRQLRKLIKQGSFVKKCSTSTQTKCHLLKSSNVSQLVQQKSKNPKESLNIFKRWFKYLRLGLPTGLTIGSFGISTVFCLQQKPNNDKLEQQGRKIIDDVDENNNVVLKKKQEEELYFPWGHFLQLLKPHMFWLISAIVGAVAVAYLNIQIPLILGEVVNALVLFANENSVNSRDFVETISQPAKKLILFYGMQGFLTSLYITFLFNLGENLASDLKQMLFHSIIVQDVAFFDRHRTGDLVNRLTVDVQEFKSSFKLCISQGLKNIVQTVGCVVTMVMLSPKLTITLVGLVAGIIVLGSILGRGLRSLSRMAQKQTSKSTVVAEEAIGNLRTVRAFAMENIEEEHYNRETDKSSITNKKLGLGIAAFQGLSNVALNGLILSTLLVGGWLMSENEINAGILMSFLVATQAIQRSLEKLSLLYGVSVQGLNAGARVFEHLIAAPGMPIKGGQIIPYHSLTCNIKFKDVTFSYPTRQDQVVLQNFSLEISGGKKLALVGPSGGGKSTIAFLLERFYDVDEGSITIDDLDLKTLDPSWVRGRLIGYISQEPVLFASSIKENIKYGKPGATDDEVYEAAKQANAHDFIVGFPDGYDTILGERGVTISGGQKQRIAIARALIKNPPIFILDEATSALDVESEKIVQEAIDNISKGRTVISIAHRLSTIKDADVVAVIVDGQLVEVGKYEDLKSKKGAFWNFVKLQQ
ncbi:hypothetical protein HELRODRAFT_94228 [Helobdella robusta]|uniref:Mitochondrial potassium channel ATP-binding subunit n=1 Tax=Helobdella robusta TaxID=6412 RepID=T1G8Z5_HELRO|nr:hypothetical protein HELRODRAFT_94228 [Helobdella robusta]ESO06704.1 hypothetical protein HELRODRAFT_94228 [Helobdella robusta]